MVKAITNRSRECPRLGPNFWPWVAVVLFVIQDFLAEPALAQMGSPNIWPVQVLGSVEVAPGANVLTLKIKNEEIRFAVNDVRSNDRQISLARFLSEARPHSPSLYLRGDDALLDVLLKEKPGKRALRLSGVFYVETRVFVISNVAPFKELPKPTF